MIGTALLFFALAIGDLVAGGLVAEPTGRAAAVRGGSIGGFVLMVATVALQLPWPATIWLVACYAIGSAPWLGLRVNLSSAGRSSVAWGGKPTRPTRADRLRKSTA